jgi:cytochrome b6-f complex iron-sulfur subunit
MKRQNCLGIDVTESTPKTTKTDRRTFLQWSIFGLLITIFGAAINVVIRYLMPSPKAMKTKKLKISQAQIPLGDSLKLEYQGIPVILIHTETGFSAFNATCTHLGCLVKWVPKEKIFFCPCHAGKYDRQGNVIAGPPPEPLHKVRIKVKEDSIIFV